MWALDQLHKPLLCSHQRSASLYSCSFITTTPAELGIDIPSILQKTKAILLHQMKSNCLDDLDFGGALIFLLLLGGLHLLVRLTRRLQEHAVA
jgi:hypothetical protein